MKKYEIAVFDVDGTLLDTTEGVLAAVQYTIDKMGFSPLSKQQLYTFIGPPIQDSFAKAYELLKAKPYEGIYEVFETLTRKGIKLAVATYKRQDYAEIILKHFGFHQYTNILYGADHENKLKKVDIIKKCMCDLGVYDYTNAVMIGDSSHDALGAKKIGMDFLGVTYGFDFKSSKDVFQFNAIGVANTPKELLKYFE